MAILVVRSVTAQEALLSPLSLTEKDEKWLDSVLETMKEIFAFDIVQKHQLENQAIIKLKMTMWPKLDLTRELVKVFVKRYGQGRVSISEASGGSGTTLVLHPTDTKLNLALITLNDDKTVEIVIYTHIEGT